MTLAGNVDLLADRIADEFNDVRAEVVAGYQPLDPDLTQIAGLAPADDSFMQRKSGLWVGRSVAQVKTDLAYTKADVGLGSVDNTSDAGKPVSTAQQAALDLKADLASPALTGTPTAPTAAAATNTTQLATTAFVQTLINNLINGAPGTLDTLKEIADQLAADESAVSALTTTVAGKQPLDAELTAIAGLTSAADKAPYFTGSGAAALMDVTSFARPIMAATTGGAIRSIINAQIADATLTALSGLATGADKLPYSTGTDTFAQADFTSFARTLLDDADATAARATLGITEARSAEQNWARDAAGLLCSNAYGVTTLTAAMGASVRTLHVLLGKLPAGTSIAAIKWWISTAMVGGAASVALYESATLAGTSWSRIGSNVTCTTQLQSTGRQSVTYSGTVGASNAWIRAEIVTTTLPSTHPVFIGIFPLVTTDAGARFICGTSNGTTAPGSTLDPSTGWSDLGAYPAMALA